MLCTNRDGPSGRCQFGRKCTFAHGEKQLRTPEKNEADGIINDRAIRSFLSRRRGPRPCVEPPRGSVSVAVNNDTPPIFLSIPVGGAPRKEVTTAPLSTYRRDPYSLVQPKKILSSSIDVP